MESLLNFESVEHSRCLLDGMEECGFNGEYTLPEYCPDMAVVLKCWAEPRLQSRQFSADKLLLDGVVNLRVIYLDEGRCHVHSVEFSVPYSCALHGCEACDSSPVFYDLTTKYVNCRATNARRLEVHGAVQVSAQAYGNVQSQIAVPVDNEGLYTRCDCIKTSRLLGSAEKIMTLSEVLEFPQSLPAAEMLLGGTCTALVKEWKVLNGKVIARGVVKIHQLYTDDQQEGTTQCLDFELPFSQIVDVIGAHEGSLCCGDVLVLSDMERCSVGPDGSNTLLEVTVKLMLQLQLYEVGETSLLREAYHTQYPIEQKYEEVERKTFCDCQTEQAVLPVLLDIPDAECREILDVCVVPQNTMSVMENHLVTISGTLMLSVLGRNREGEILYFEKGEEYRLEFPGVGNESKVKVHVSDLHYRVVDGKIELQVGLAVWLCHYQLDKVSQVCALRLCTDQAYPSTKTSALLYYAHPGESLWDIARDCHTSPQLLCQENELTGDVVVNPCVLLVPLV